MRLSGLVLRGGAPRRNLAAFVLLSLTLAACGPSKGEILDMRKRARNLAVQESREDLAARSYKDVFGETACFGDCSARSAGFRWAADRNISDPHDCSGPTRAFTAGCRAFADEVQRRAELAADRAANVEW